MARNVYTDVKLRKKSEPKWFIRFERRREKRLSRKAKSGAGVETLFPSIYIYSVGSL